MKTASQTRPASPISVPDPGSTAASPLYTVPDWARPNPADASLEGAVFCAAISLKTLDDLVRSDPVWLGCFRDRQALVCAHAACQWLRLKTDAGALRDAVLLCGPDGDPGPAGRVYQITRRLSRRAPSVSSKTITALTQALGLKTLSDPDLTSVVDAIETSLPTRQSPPLAAAALITRLYHLNPDWEILAWILADNVIAARLGWSAPVPLLLSARFDPVLRLRQGRGRMNPEDPDFARALCLAFSVAIRQALNSANAIARNASSLLTAAPKLRSKGAQTIIQQLLEEDSLLATAPDSGLSRWAAPRLFARLISFGAVRELSGRSSFKIYGL